LISLSDVHYLDKNVVKLPIFETAVKSLRKANIEFIIFDEGSGLMIINPSLTFFKVEIEPTDVSFKLASKFASEGSFDGFISVGGGSVMDTCKAANLYSTWPPSDFLDYVNMPIGKAQAPPGPLKPHISVPTTSGTGSELTGFAIFDLLERKSKTGIGHK
jgi:alcohol dehydrogenase class IV